MLLYFVGDDERQLKALGVYLTHSAVFPFHMNRPVSHPNWIGAKSEDQFININSSTSQLRYTTQQ